MNRPRPPGPPARDGGTHTGKAIVVIAVVVVIGWLVLKHGPSTRAATTATTHPRTTVTSTPATTVAPTTTTLVPAASIKLQVLNGTGSGNLAGTWSVRLKANPGYNTLAPDNATSTVAQSVIYIITPGYLPEARQLAVATGLPASAINPTIPAPSSAPIPATERANANLVLVIGPDLANKA